MYPGIPTMHESIVINLRWWTVIVIFFEPYKIESSNWDLNVIVRGNINGGSHLSFEGSWSNCNF